jgi:hypothetical protein
MIRQKKLLLFFLIVAPSLIFATTWDEPWQKDVIKEADYFVFARIKSSDESSVTIEIVKSLAGKELKGTIKITGFYLLNLCSTSGGHGPEFHFGDAKECYLFIKKNKKGEYCIATPTAGYANVRDGNVTATYRHSYHQARVPVDIYERTMTAIFKNYHNQSYDKSFIESYVKKYIYLTPAGFEQEEIATFFAQHVALECVYHLGMTGLYANIIPFLYDTVNFHNQVSAARALISYNTAECKNELLKIIGDTTRADFVKVICIWTLSEFKPKELKEQLTKIDETASTEENGFGGDIMDPRVCTHFPNVKDAIRQLVESL